VKVVEKTAEGDVGVGVIGMAFEEILVFLAHYGKTLLDFLVERDTGGTAAVWNNLANYYGHRGPINKAFEFYAKAIELDGHQSVYYHNLAILVYLYRTDASAYYHLTETQVFDKSLDLYREAIRLAPDDFVLFSDYAESFYGTKPPRLKDGLAAWTQALKIAHDDVEREGVYIHLARINLKLGNYAEAGQSLNVITNPVYAFLKNKISRNLKAAMSDSVTNAPPLTPTKIENK
jgi:tetratricopeptide (TPR) repeat protein